MKVSTDKKILLLIYASLLLSGCSDPFKSAKEAAESSKAAAKNSKDAADRSKFIKDYTEHTMEAMKGGAGLEAREDAFSEAIKEENFTHKTDHTAVFFQSMSFQLLGVMEQHTLDLAYTRDKQKADSVRDFSKKMISLLEKDSTLLDQLLKQLNIKSKEKKLTALDKDNKMQTVYAFAATMHEINMIQRNNLGLESNPTLKVVSFFDVITDSLAKRPKDLNGTLERSSLSLTDQEVLREATILIKTLKYRYMILPVIALGRMSNIKDGLIEAVSMLSSNWSIRSDLGTEEINYLNDIFDRTKKTKEFLDSIGEKVSLDPKVAKIYKNLQIEDFDTLSTSSSSVGAEKVQAMNNLSLRVKDL